MKALVLLGCAAMFPPLLFAQTGGFASSPDDRVDFEALDEDGDGSISRSEFSLDTGDDLFTQMDSNLDRSLSRQEVESFNRSRSPAASAGGTAGLGQTSSGRTDGDSAGRTGGLGQTSSGRSDRPDIGSRFGSGVNEEDDRSTTGSPGTSSTGGTRR